MLCLIDPCDPCVICRYAMCCIIKRCIICMNNIFMCVRPSCVMHVGFQ